MTKAEMEKLLIEKYGYEKTELKNEKGNPLTNSVLEKMIESEERKRKEREDSLKSVSDESQLGYEEDYGVVDETIFQSTHSFKDDDLILCMSGVNGEMNFVSKLSNFRIKTTSFGQAIKIPYKDLRYVYSTAPEAFEQGKVIVLNKQIQEEFGLSDLYKKAITPKNVKQVINMNPNDLKDFIIDMPKAMKVSLYDEARKMYHADKIDSMKTIKVLEEGLGVSFDDNAPLKDFIKE